MTPEPVQISPWTVGAEMTVRSTAIAIWFCGWVAFTAALVAVQNASEPEPFSEKSIAQPWLRLVDVADWNTACAFLMSPPEITAGLLSHAIEGFLRHAFLYEAVERDRLVAAAKEFVHKVLAN